MRRMLGLVIGLLLMIPVASPPAAAAMAWTIYGTVTDSAGRPIPGAEVEVYRLGAGLIGVWAIPVGGAFDLPAPGPFGTLLQLRFWAPGYRTYETGWFDPTAQRVHAVRLEPIQGSLEISLRDRDGRLVSGTAILTSRGGAVAARGDVHDGQLQLQGLESGDYRLLVIADGFTDTVETVTVRAGTVVTKALTLTRPGAAMTGQVKDGSTGNPLTKVTVILETAAGLPVAETLTDEQGVFRSSLAVGVDTYRLRISAPGYQMETREQVELEPGRELDFSGPQAIALRPLTGALTGVLVNHHGSSLGGRSMVLYLQGYGEVAKTKSDTNGEFRFDRLPAGTGLRYRVIADEVTDGEGWAAQGGSDWVELVPGGVAHTLIQTSTWYGSYYSLTRFSGAVQNTAGAPLAGAKVELIRRTRVEYTTETDADGLFSFKSVSGTEGYFPAQYTIRISKEGYVTTREVRVGEAMQTEIRLPEGQRPSVRAVLRPEVALLRGKVLGRDGAPLRGAQVRLVGADGDTLNTAITDRQGWYTFPEVSVKPSSGYQLRITAEGYYPQPGLEVTNHVLKVAELPTVRLQPSRATVTGTVLGFDGKAIANVVVRLLGQGATPLGEVVSGTDGRYRLDVPLPVTGPLRLAADQWGRLPILQEVGEELAPGGTVTKDLVIWPSSGALEGRVMDEAGVPIDGVRVELVAEGQGVVASAISRGGGRYSFAEIPTSGRWVWLRATPRTGVFAGSRRHGTDLVPLMRLLPGEQRVLDLVIRRLSVPDSGNP